MAIEVKHKFVSAIPDGDDASVVRPSNWNDTHELTGLGTMAEQNANNVAITGGSISGATVSGYIPTTQKGAVNGVASLDSNGQVPLSQLPPLGELNYQGTWNATTNSPTLTSSVGTKGFYYVVSVAGTTNLNGITDWQIGDWAVYNGTAWQKVDNTDAVTSVNGQTGTVVLTASDVGAQPAGTYVTSVGATSPVASSGGTTPTISMPAATTSVSGYLTNTDWNIFNSKGSGSVTSVGGTGTVSGISLSGTVTTSGNLTLGGTLNLSIPPAIGGTTPNAITGTTIIASTGFVSENYLGLPGLGGNLKTNGGTSLLNWDGGGSGNVTVNGGLNANPSNKNVSIAPTGTGTATINPATAGTMNNMAIGGTTAAAGSFTDLSVTGTASFDGSQGTAGQVLTSAGTGATPTWTTPTTGTVTSVTGTAPVVSSGGNTPAISMAAATTSVPGYLTAADWTTFNAKQTALVSGTNIKTINTNSILGSGDLTIAATPAGSNTQVQYNNSGALGASANLTFASNTLTAPNLVASNGLVMNNGTVGASFSIASGYNAMSVGPVTVASGQSVTVPSGSRWVVL